MTFNNFSQRYGVNLTNFNYMSLVDAIPLKWRHMVTKCTFPTNLISNAEVPYVEFPENAAKEVTQVSSKDFYTFFKKSSAPSCLDAWNTRLQINFSQKYWAQIFCLSKQTVSDTRVLNMQFKLIHRCYATNSIISKWDTTKSAVCNTCNQKANIIHNFYLCDDVQNFWKSFELWYANTCNTQRPNLSVKDVLFGKFQHVKHDCLNHMILYGKFYIHKQFVNDKKLFFNNFIPFYSHILEIEKHRYVEKQQLNTFEKRFGKCVM